MKYTLLLLFILTHYFSFSQFQKIGSLSEAKCWNSAVRAGDSILVIGGDMSLGVSSKIEVYYPKENKWGKTIEMPSGVSAPACVVGDSAIYIAGGTVKDSRGTRTSDKLFILKKGKFQEVELNEPVLFYAGVKLGNTIIFREGIEDFTTSSMSTMSVVINESTNTITYETIENPLSFRAVANSATVAIYAGGYDKNGTISKRVDIYNKTTNEWTTSELSEARFDCTAAYADGKFYVIGGGLNNAKSSSAVDVFDSEGKFIETMNLDVPRAMSFVAVTENKLVMVGGITWDSRITSYDAVHRNISVYNFKTDEWENDKYLDKSLYGHTALIGFDNAVYLAGGGEWNGSGWLRDLQVYDLTASVGEEFRSVISIYPTSVNDVINISGVDFSNENSTVEILDIHGRSIISNPINNFNTIDVSGLKQGVYVAKVIDQGNIYSQKFVKK
ncbi:MAG: T9SS type A sorting domain-containing protein [Bacteroidetes bacterium]|nr:T9SS type A sorting domain-containing protein [Bacteroidota bacterium]